MAVMKAVSMLVACNIWIGIRLRVTQRRIKCFPCHKAQVSWPSRRVAWGAPSLLRCRACLYSKRNVGLQLSRCWNGPPAHPRVERAGIAAKHPVAIAIVPRGCHSYGIRIGQSLFQSPISWFSQTHPLGRFPGYAAKAGLDFDRRITMSAFFATPGGMRQVTDRRTVITCELMPCRFGQTFCKSSEAGSICARQNLREFFSARRGKDIESGCPAGAMPIPCLLPMRPPIPRVTRKS